MNDSDFMDGFRAGLREAIRICRSLQAAEERKAEERGGIVYAASVEECERALERELKLSEEGKV